MAMSGPPLLLFDDTCGMCNASVRFILDHEADQEMRFAPARSAVGEKALSRCGLCARPESIVLIEGGKCYLRSDATVRVARHLCWPYSWLALLAAIPGPVRNRAYDWVARHRYALSRNVQQCRPVLGRERERFVG